MLNYYTLYQYDNYSVVCVCVCNKTFLNQTMHRNATLDTHIEYQISVKRDDIISIMIWLKLVGTLSKLHVLFILKPCLLPAYQTVFLFE